MLLTGSDLTAREFRARLTAARLSHPLVDNLYALDAARIKFIPFQFKPLLRFLHAEQPRLLIADEVGVGKTIEAGLVLNELASRQQLDTVLVACPKALVFKWRDEMRRFDERFRILKGEDLRYCLREAHLDGAWPTEYSRAIVSLELARIDDYLGPVNGRRTQRVGFLDLSPPPRFSLLIVDEAHHLRNPDGNSHRLARLLCDNSEAALLLSATPLQVGSENLYTLLALLRPDLFPDQAVFDEAVEPNRYITLAMRQVRAPPDDWQRAAAQTLETAAATNWGRRVLVMDPLFRHWQERLAQPAALSDEERIRCLRDLEEGHTLSQVMNRTRRRDIGPFTLRDPQTVEVPFTPAQEAFYQELVELRRQLLLQHYDPVVVPMILDTLQRQAASCLPATAQAVDAFLAREGLLLAAISDDPELGEEQFEVPATLLRVRAAQRLRASAAALPPDDPKLQRLLEVVEQTRTGEGSGKLLVFSLLPPHPGLPLPAPFRPGRARGARNGPGSRR